MRRRSASNRDRSNPYFLPHGILELSRVASTLFRRASSTDLAPLNVRLRTSTAPSSLQAAVCTASAVSASTHRYRRMNWKVKTYSTRERRDRLQTAIAMITDTRRHDDAFTKKKLLLSFFLARCDFSCSCARLLSREGDRESREIDAAVREAAGAGEQPCLREIDVQRGRLRRAGKAERAELVRETPVGGRSPLTAVASGQVQHDDARSNEDLEPARDVHRG